MTISYMDRLEKSITHVEGHRQDLSERVVGCLAHIVNRTGNPYACALTLRSHAEASAIIAWFVHNDLGQFKQWCYVGGKIGCATFKKMPQRVGALYIPWLWDVFDTLYSTAITTQSISAATSNGASVIVNVTTESGGVHAIVVDSITNKVANIRDPWPPGMGSSYAMR